MLWIPAYYAQIMLHKSNAMLHKFNISFLVSYFIYKIFYFLWTSPVFLLFFSIKSPVYKSHLQNNIKYFDLSFEMEFQVHINSV